MVGVLSTSPAKLYGGGGLSLSRVPPEKASTVCAAIVRVDEPCFSLIHAVSPLHDAHGTSLLLLLLFLLSSLFYCTCGWFKTSSVKSLFSSRGEIVTQKADRRLRATTKSACQGIGTWACHCSACPTFIGLSVQSASYVSLALLSSACSFLCLWDSYAHITQ